jgi:hypothetical protein
MFELLPYPQDTRLGGKETNTLAYYADSLE